MTKRLALLFIVLLFVLTVVPAHYPPGDEALRQNSPLCDIYTQPFIASGTFCDFHHHQDWTGVILSWDISYRQLPDIPSTRGTRAPPL